MRSSSRAVLVLGAGAAGLAAGRALARAGLRVTVVEARPRWGGRVDTRRDARLGVPVEGGGGVRARAAAADRAAGAVRFLPDLRAARRRGSRWGRW